MHILVVSQYFWPENFRINDLVSELIQRGHEVVVLTGLPNYPDGKIMPEFIKNTAFYSHYNGAKVIRVPIVSRGNNAFMLVLNYLTFAISASVAGVWKLRGRHFDAIFTYEPSPVTVGLPAILLRSVKKAPLIFWVLDLWPETIEAIGVIRHKSILFFIKKLVSFIYKRCDLILAQSKSFIPKIRKYAGVHASIEYFPGWAETIESPISHFDASAMQKNKIQFNILFAGNIGEAQDFPTILSAAEILKNYSELCWFIIGSGRMYGWVAKEIQSRCLENCVYLLGRYPLEAMPSFFEQADALLVSLKDNDIFSLTIPAKVQSYLAAGKPILGMLKGEGANIITNSGAGISTPPGDPSALVRAVLVLLSLTAEQRFDMGQKGIEFSNKEFNKKHLISRLECLLKMTRANYDELEIKRRGY
jgi:glycosyltransferase involved in cell wall biosynthesis